LLRARTLADKAHVLAADSESTLELQARILRAEGRCDEVLAAYTALMRSSGHSRIDVGVCLRALGRSAEAVRMLEEVTWLDRDMRARFSRYWVLGVALVRIGRYEEAISWLRAANEAFSGSSLGISWNLAIAYAHTGKVADARRELQEFRKQTGGVFTTRYLRHAAGTLGEDYAREVGGPFMALLPDHTPEEANAGLPITEGVRPAYPIVLTPIGCPRGLDDQDIRTSATDRRRKSRERRVATPAVGQLQQLPARHYSGHQFCSRRVSKRSA
jgi:Tetratricopeptide repeat